MKVMKFVRPSSFQQLLARRMNVGVSITVNIRTIYGNAVLAPNVAGSVHGVAQQCVGVSAIVVGEGLVRDCSPGGCRIRSVTSLPHRRSSVRIQSKVSSSFHIAIFSIWTRYDGGDP